LGKAGGNHDWSKSDGKFNSAELSLEITRKRQLKEERDSTTKTEKRKRREEEPEGMDWGQSKAS